MECLEQSWNMTASLSLEKLKMSALPFATSKCQDIKELNLESIVLRERSQSQKTVGGVLPFIRKCAELADLWGQKVHPRVLVAAGFERGPGSDGQRV